MDVLPDNVVERALVVIAHPDDAEFWRVAPWPAGLDSGSR